METVVTDETWDGENVPEVYIDWLNQEVRVGDTVLYGITKGRSAAVVVGRVMEFRLADAQGKPLEVTRYDYDTREYNKTPMWNFKIQPIKDAYGYRSRDKNQLIRPVVIGTIHNVTLVDATLVDEVDA